jgi:hypothetical protein
MPITSKKSKRNYPHHIVLDKDDTDTLVENLFTHKTTGNSSEWIPNYIPQDVYAPYQWGNSTYPSNIPSISNPSVPPAKQQFNPEDHQGKYCAHVHLTYHGVEHTGILFVKKCGHWKLLEYNGAKIAGGNSGSFEAECKKGILKIEVIHVLYDADKPIVQPAKELEGYGELDILDIIGENGLEIS